MITKGNWEVIEQEQVGLWSVKVWLILKDGRLPTVAHIVKGEILLEELKEGAVEVEPTFNINLDAWRTLKAAMVDTKVREKNEVEAELGATKYHLEDLRKLLKLTNP